MASNSAIPPTQPSQTPNTPPPSSAAPPPSSAAPPPPPSSNTPAPPPSSNPPSSSPPRTSAAPPPPSTQVVTAPSAAPTATDIQTSFIIVTAPATRPGESAIVITSVLTIPPGSRPTNAVDASKSAAATSTNPTEFQNAKSETSGLSPGGKTAIAVVIPVIAVALLVLGALFFWRKRKQRKSNEDERRKEVEEYGFNPNHDPTLPAVGMAMAEDDSGYRGWGNTNSSKGKGSTTLTSGVTHSDSNSNPGGYAVPNSPTHGTYTDGNPHDPLMNRRETLDSDGIGALGAVGGAAPYSSQNAGVRRGPSNASSSYSAAGQSDNSGEYPGMPNNGHHDYYHNDAQGYYQSNPYGNHDPYANGPTQGQQPVIRDVSARRNTRIENPSVFPQQGNSGISQNF